MITATDWWRFLTLRCIVINIPINVCEDQIQGVTSSNRKRYHLSQWDNIFRNWSVMRSLKSPYMMNFSNHRKKNEALTLASRRQIFVPKCFLLAVVYFNIGFQKYFKQAISPLLSVALMSILCGIGIIVY